MKGVVALLMLGLCFSCQFLTAQRTKAPAPRIKAKAVQSVEMFPFENYSYPFYAIINNGSAPVTGCFIKHEDSIYFVTTRHSFYTTTSEKRKITNVMIFLEQENWNKTAKVLSLNMNEQRLLPVCFDFGCTDIILLPVELPKDISVNFVTLDAKEIIEEKEMTIAGFTKDSANIVFTKFDSYLGRDSTFFLTTKSGSTDQAGSPVLMHAKVKGISKAVLAGIYSGKEISQDHFDKGLVSRAEFITRFLIKKANDDALRKPKPEIIRKKRA